MLTGSRNLIDDRNNFVKKKLKEKSAGDVIQEMLECEKDLKVYKDMQKVYAFDYIEFVRWTEQLAHR